MSYTGRSRSRVTPKHVKTAERVARALISSGGIGTIIAVILIFVFLVSVVMPLFSSGEVSKSRDIAVLGTKETIRMAVDELQLIGYKLERNGAITVFSLEDGSVLDRRSLFGGKTPTAWTFNPNGSDCAFGFADGTIRYGKIEFTTSFLDQVPENLAKLKPGESGVFEKGVVVVTPKKQHRLQALAVTIDETIETGEGSLHLVDYSIRPDGSRVFSAVTADGKLRMIRGYVNEIMGTIDFEPLEVEYDIPSGRSVPDFMFMNGGATTLILGWNDGLGHRVDIREDFDPKKIEEMRFTDEGDSVTMARPLLGKSTLMIGTKNGHIDAWFLIKPKLVFFGETREPKMEGDWEFKDPERYRKVALIPKDSTKIDKDEIRPIARDLARMVRGHRLESRDSAIVSFSPSKRSRMLTASYADGVIRTYQVTTQSMVAETKPFADTQYVVLSPKEDGIYALSQKGMRAWKFDPKHPEATFQSLFGKIWYEGYAQEDYAWQSTGGSSGFEPKLSLRPLIYGTIKATTYSIMIAAPLALLAAIFTSQFLAVKLRTPIKSGIEMMASLPSVVLGFLAAIVIAPYVQGGVPIMLAAFITVPFALLLGSRLWQLLPTRVAIMWGGWQRFVAIGTFLPIGILMAAVIGPWMENGFFGGNLKAWLSDSPDNTAGGVGGWMILLMPVSLLLMVLLNTYIVAPRVRNMSTDWSRQQCAIFDICKLVVQLAIVLLVAWLGALFMSTGAFSFVGFDADPRGGVLGNYNQRNALIVGFVMGFAVVPIIYTLAEDALSSVPSQLREGSLGAGATPWQTAWRIVIPTAMSGLFGALMVGLGRAVGETMIVLMAAGNTPIMEPSMFSGFRTLSANIAVELPEAVKDDTHYRALFLAALVLFAMTFCINIFAEGVRRIFRRRFADL